MSNNTDTQHKIAMILVWAFETVKKEFDQIYGGVNALTHDLNPDDAQRLGDLTHDLEWKLALLAEYLSFDVGIAQVIKTPNSTRSRIAKKKASTAASKRRAAR